MLKVSKYGTIKYDDYMAEELKDRDEAAEYLSVCLEDNDPRLFLVAVRHVVGAQGGIAAVARKTGLNREALYRMLSKKGNPRMENLFAILAALGFSLAVNNASVSNTQTTNKRRRAA